MWWRGEGEYADGDSFATGEEPRPRGEGRPEQRMRAQGAEIRRVEVHARRVRQRLPKTACQHEAAVARQFAKEERHRQTMVDATGIEVRDEGGELIGVE